MNAPAPTLRTSDPEDAVRPAAFGGRPLFETLLPMARPGMPEAPELLEQCRRVLASGQWTNGETVRRFERAAAAWLDVPDCVAVSSCTLGLILVERCLGLRGRVIVPSFTFFATAHSLLWNGLEPVLVDCDPWSWNLDPARVRRVLDLVPGVSAILAVHVFGNPAAVEELSAIAQQAGVRLIFDAAHAFGARRNGRRLGGWGDAEVFSLSPTKPLPAGEGGLIAVRDPELAGALRAARNYGHAGDYDCSVLGLNARMTEFQAALALASLPAVERNLERRNRLAAAYESVLGSEPGICLQQVRPQDCSTRKDFSLVVDPMRFGVPVRLLQSALEQERIEVRRYFDPPLHRQRLYRAFYRPALDRLENSEAISRGVLSLPIHPGMDEGDAARIARRIVEIRDWVLYGGPSKGRAAIWTSKSPAASAASRARA